MAIKSTCVALVQDQHTRPGSVFLTVMTPVGAYFNDFGPLTAGTYHVSAEIWLTPWPSTSGGYLYDEGSLQLTVTGVGAHETPPGDFNGDNVVDASDYVVWRRADGTPENYETWRSNFGATAGNGNGSALGTPSQPAVPEPAGAILLLSWAALGAWTRRQIVSRLPTTHSRATQANNAPISNRCGRGVRGQPMPCPAPDRFLLAQPFVFIRIQLLCGCRWVIIAAGNQFLS